MFPTNNDFESEFTFEQSANLLPDEPPFYALVLGNWSGDGEKNDLNLRRPVEIDRDNFEEVLKKLNVRLEIDWQNSDGDKLNLRFSTLDDFHPDNLFRQIPLFSELRDIRRQLSNSDTFNSAANKVRSWFQNPQSENTDHEIQTDLNDAPPIDSNNLLDLILTEPRESQYSATQTVDKSELSRFVSRIVKPHLIQIDENEQSTLISAVDETISELMRAVIHHPKFQTLEAAWRGLYFLVRRLETNSQLKIFILEVSKDELANDLRLVDNLSDSFLYRQLISEFAVNVGNLPFSLIGGNYDFGIDVDDIALLMRIGKIGTAADVPFLSYIKPEIFGIENFLKGGELISNLSPSDSTKAKLWSALRSVPEAQYIGLSPMKVFGRMPYGKDYDQTETFNFEEIREEVEFHKFLRVNPCFINLLLLSQSYRLNGWQMRKNLQREVDKLPVCFFQVDGEIKSFPISEIVLNEKLLEAILNQGMIPLVASRDSDKIRVWRFQSISSTHPTLNGKWNL